MQPQDLIAPPLITLVTEVGKRLGLPDQLIQPIVLIWALIFAIAPLALGGPIDQNAIITRVGYYATAAIGVWELIKPLLKRSAGSTPS